MNEILIGLSIGIVVGIVLGYFINRFLLTTANNKMIENAKDKAELLIKEAELKGENLKQDRIRKAQQKYQELKSKFEKNANVQKEKLDTFQNKLKQREGNLNTQSDRVKKESSKLKSEQDHISSIRKNLEKQINAVSKKQEELDNLIHKQVADLEKIAGLSAEEAKEKMIIALQE